MPGAQSQACGSCKQLGKNVELAPWAPGPHCHSLVLTAMPGRAELVGGKGQPQPGEQMLPSNRAREGLVGAEGCGLVLSRGTAGMGAGRDGLGKGNRHAEERIWGVPVHRGLGRTADWEQGPEALLPPGSSSELARTGAARSKPEGASTSGPQATSDNLKPSAMGGLSPACPAHLRSGAWWTHRPDFRGGQESSLRSDRHDLEARSNTD